MAYRAIARALDTLDIAFCWFDANDISIMWNETFLRFFPEHRGQIFVGEHYSENLRRFYRARLSAVDLPFIERYVADGVARNRGQTRPFHFEHNGRWVRVSSVPEPSGGRIRIWTQISPGQSTDLRDQQTERIAAVSIPDQLAFLETVGEAATFFDAHRRITLVNEQFLEIYGVSDPVHIAQKTYPELVHLLWSRNALATERAKYAQDISAALMDGINFSGAPFEVPLPGGKWVRVAMNWAAGGECYALHWDITESKRHETELRDAERRARESERQLRAVTNNLRIETHRLEQTEARIRTTFISSGIPTLVVGNDGTLIDANDAAGTLFQYSVVDLLRLSLADVMEDKAREIVAALLEEGGERGQMSGVEIEFLKKDGISGICEMFGARAIVDAGETPYAVLHVLDVTSRKRDESEKEARLLRLQSDALNDPLTGLGNRRYLEIMLRDRMLDGESHCLLFVDLDGFKAVNDESGHSAGDLLLKEIAKVLVSSSRATDFVGRLGGDEFLVILQSCDQEGAHAVAETVIASVAELGKRLLRGGKNIGASVGIRVFCGDKDSVETLIDHADAACYAAKRKGKSRVEVFNGIARR